MDWLEYFKLLGMTSLPVVAIILGLFYVGKNVINNYFNSSLENYKLEMELVHRKNAVVFERLHAKKIEAIGEVYSKLNILYKSLTILTADLKQVPQGKNFDDYQNELTNEFAEKYNSFIDTYLSNNLYLSKSSCDNIEQILREYRNVSVEYDSMRFLRNAGVKDGEAIKDAFLKSREASKKVQNEFPKTLDELKTRFNEEIEKFEIDRPKSN